MACAALLGGVSGAVVVVTADEAEEIKKRNAEEEAKRAESAKVEVSQAKPHPLGRMTIEEAMQRTGTTSPKAALAKLNEGRVGRKRYSYMPHTGDRARARYKRQLEKERAREAAKVQAAE